jgi:hypothetical protein
MKTIMLENWVSSIPDKMFNKWVKNGIVPNDADIISEGKKGARSKYIYHLQKDELHKYPFCKSEKRRLIAQGFEEKGKCWVLSGAKFYKLKREVASWYDRVFTYITNWFTDEGFIDLKSGSFSGGFCAEEDPNNDAVKSWGAPLANEENRVAQIKEKFGDFVVYLYGTTEDEMKKITKFARKVEKKFDCMTRFC